MSGTINRKEAEFDFSEAADIICDKLFMFHGDEFGYEEGLEAINACTRALNGMMRQMIREHDAQAKRGKGKMKATTLLHMLENAKVFEKETGISKEVYISVFGEEYECSSIRGGRDRIVLCAEADNGKKELCSRTQGRRCESCRGI